MSKPELKSFDDRVPHMRRYSQEEQLDWQLLAKLASIYVTQYCIEEGHSHNPKRCDAVHILANKYNMRRVGNTLDFDWRESANV
jgi:hypothetical protein